MKTYQLSNEKTKQRRMRRGRVIRLVIALITSTLLTVFQQSDDPLSIGTYLIIFAGFFTLLFIGFQVCSKVGEALLKSPEDAFRLTLSDHAIIIKEAGVKEITIPREQITQLRRTKRNDILVFFRGRGSDRTQFMRIPASLEGYDEVQAQLVGWRSIDDVARIKIINLLQPALLLVGIAGGAVVATGASQNPLIVLPLGTIALIVFGFLAFTIIRNPNLERLARIISVILTITPMISVTLRMILVLYLLFTEGGIP